jgi:hypothetical protein
MERGVPALCGVDGSWSSSDAPVQLRAALAADVGSAHIRARTEVNARLLAPILDAAESSLPERERPAFRASVAVFRGIVRRYWHGVAGAGRLSLVALLNDFLAVEKLFGSSAMPDAQRTEDVLYGLNLVLAAKAGAVDPPPGLSLEAVPSASAADGAAEATRLTAPDGSPLPRGSAVEEACAVARAHAHLQERTQVVMALLDRVAEELERGKQLAAAAALREADEVDGGDGRVDRERGHGRRDADH